MATIRRKLIFLIAFLTLWAGFASCEKSILAGRVYSGTFDGTVATISFDEDGTATFELKDRESAALEYSAGNGYFQGSCTHFPAKVFSGKYDDDSLYFSWWGGEDMVLQRAYYAMSESSINAEKSSQKPKGKKLKWIIIIGGILLVFIFVKASIDENKCPKCEKIDAIEETNREYLGSSEGYETKTRQDIQRNSNGEQIGTIERQEQVHVITDHYRVYCKCKYCGYQYSYKTSKTYEG